MNMRTQDVFRIAAVVLGMYVAGKVLLLAHNLMFVVFLGILFGVAVSAGAARLQRLRIPRPLGSGLIITVIIAAFFGFGAWVGPTVKDQYNELRAQIPVAIEKLDQRIDKYGLDISQETIMEKLGGAQKYILPFLSSTVAIVSGLLLVIFIAIYSSAHSDLYRRGFLALLPAQRRERANNIISEVITSLRKWLVTQLIAMIIIGLVTTIVLTILDVKAALPLGILAGILEFVPTIGPIISAVPAIVMGFSDSPEKAVIVALAYTGIQFVENQLLIPILMKEGVDIPPLLTIITQAAMAFFFGFMGLFVAVPVLVVGMILVRTLYLEPLASAETPAET